MNELDFYESVIHAIEQERDPIDANEPANSILNGHLIILVSLCNKRPERITIELIDFLLYQCLFYTKTVQLAKGPDIKCKKPETIKSALELLFVLCKAEETNRI